MIGHCGLGTHGRERLGGAPTPAQKGPAGNLQPDLGLLIDLPGIETSSGNALICGNVERRETTFC
jgi:hypothetical protein